MFGARYFGAKFFGARYFGHEGATAPQTRGIYLGPRYFGPRYWNQRAQAGDGAFFGGRYFGHRYFGKRYFASNVALAASPFDLVVTSGVSAAAAGTMAVPGYFIYSTTWVLTLTSALGAVSSGGFTSAFSFNGVDWSFTPPLQGPTATLTPALSASFTYGGVVTEDWALAVTTGPAATAAPQLTAAPELALRIAPSALTAAGVGALALGDFAYTTSDYPLVPTAPLGAAAVGGVATGGLLYVYVHPITQTAALGAALTATLVGDVLPGSTYFFTPLTLLTPSVGASLSAASLTSYRVEPPTSAYPEDGGPMPTRPRWRRQYAQTWLDAVVNKPPGGAPGGTPPVQ